MHANMVSRTTVRALAQRRCASSTAPRNAMRTYATQTSLGTSPTSSSTRRKPVTPFNDTGRVPWGELSGAERVARTTQQSFNFGMIILGTVLTGGVAYFLYTEVFASDSKTNWFNRAVDRVKADPESLSLLGDASKISAYGEPTFNKWAMARPIAHSIKVDQTGTEHMLMHFNVEGPKGKGVVSLHMTKKPVAGSEYEYKYLKLDVRGQPTHYIEGGTASSVKKGATKFLGISWR